MLDIGGTIECRVYQYDSGFFKIYILASTLGIEPGDTFLANDKFLNPYRDIEGEWYVKLYTNSVRKKNRHKRKYKRVDRIADEVLAESVFYNEVTKINEEEVREEEWFTQNVKASIILPIIKERSKIPNSLIYVDEYWRT
jgi:hypothetical protein